MPIKKKINQRLQVQKTTNALNKAGIPGVLITEVDGQIITSLIGNQGKALSAIHLAMAQVDWMYGIAQYVTGPKINAYKDTEPPQTLEDTGETINAALDSAKTEEE